MYTTDFEGMRLKICCTGCACLAAKDGKKVKEKVKKLATKVEEEEFDEHLEMVSL